MTARRSAWLIALDWCSLAAALALAALALARIDTLPPLAWAPLLALAAALGWASADLASGIVHFLCDRFGSERTPLLGPAVIRPFREHHVAPTAITGHGFAELSGNSALALTPVLAVGSELAPLFGEALLPSALFSWLMSASVGLFTTNQIHRWAHMARAPRLARALQRVGLAITPEAHARHHSEAHDRAFCITNGWWNRPLDRAQAWSRVERWLRGAAATPRGPAPPAERVPSAERA
ncbi:MAG TPA: fatty acid desaturase CarF family protein [Myxococcota bacterium]|nr:fatty acid desaturase CarF family protein [Myxococcota bacterium]